ncbi:LPS export ABC transporter permease LptG [Desulfoluna sp.]|uniref:LPS export ABC transporter permease LptG n=1 Tax=Desulfoluna sp. TaxID=2045199 RepID=UPI00261062BD|nr:LPS export ABC transporter permease LptG [Desulfoluna sp.]
MSLIQRYVLKQFFKYFAMIQVVVFFLVVAIDYLSWISKFLQVNYNLLHGVWFVVMRNLGIIVMMTPVCALLSSVVLFGLMRRNNEIIALMGGGISAWKLIKPLSGAGLLLTVLVFILAETVVPVALNKATHIRMVDIKKRNIQTTQGNNIWLRHGREIIYIKHYTIATKTLSGISITRFADDSFVPVRRVDAASGVYTSKGWALKDAIVQEPSISGGQRSQYVDAAIDMVGVLPEDLGSVVKKAREMSFFNLWDYIRKMEKEGYDVTRYRVNFQAKMAFPLLCLMMVMIGSGIALTRPRHEGIPISVGIGIGIAFLFWIFYSLCLSLGYGEMLPPFIAAWAADVVFFCAGGLLLQDID